MFSIPAENVDACLEKLLSKDMQIIGEVEQSGWQGDLYYCVKPRPTKISWLTPLIEFFPGDRRPMNLSHFAAFVFRKGDWCLVLSYGKTHFYLRPFCDHEFGIEVAKRIANERDVRMTAGRRFQGTRRKDIKSFTNDTRLDIESGESVDYVRAGILDSHQPAFGKTGKFGASAMLLPSIEVSEIGRFLDALVAETQRPARFPLPRTAVVKEKEEIARLDGLLLDELSTAEPKTTDFAINSFDLFGVDFVFSDEGDFKITAPFAPAMNVDHLSIAHLKRYIADNQIGRDRILKIMITSEPDEGVATRRPLKDTLDFIADGENIILSDGKWMRFNQDYLDYLDDALRNISVETTEPELSTVRTEEGVFNDSDEVRAAGYEVADKDFSIVRTRAATPVEAWDLKKGGTVYAVKFGTPQKLGYVCDQAINVLELKRTNAGVKPMPEFERYCIWLGYRARQPLTDITQSGSIILKQKLELWARKAREVGVEPVLKLSWDERWRSRKTTARRSAARGR